MPGIPEELFVNADTIPVRLYCSICLDVCNEAVLTACEHLFCKSCMEEYKRNFSQNVHRLQNGSLFYECPNCRVNIEPVKPAIKAREYISHQIVYCSELQPFRCGWIGMHTHIQTNIQKHTKTYRMYFHLITKYYE